MLLFVCAPANEGVVDERVLHVNKNAHRSINAREFFDGENGAEEIRAGAAVLFRRFDAHQAELKTLADDGGVEFGGLVHVFDARAQFALGEFADAGAKHRLVFRKCGQWNS